MTLSPSDRPDFVQRALLHEDALRHPLPKEPRDLEMVFRIREAADLAITGEVRSPEWTRLLRAGLFYFHDALDDALPLAADASGALADYWRAMIHRRRGEFEEARTFGRRAGELPPFPLMHRLVVDDCPHMARQTGWDAFLLAHLWEQYRFGADELGTELRFLQRVEFRQIWEHTWRVAGR